MQMLKKLDVNKATLANIFLETKALRAGLKKKLSDFSQL